MNDTIPWAAPLNQALAALKRAEEAFMKGDVDAAVGEVRTAEENARHCRYCVEASR